MTAWDELQQWLMMNVGSKQAEECNALVNRVVAEARSESSIVSDCMKILTAHIQPNGADADTTINGLLEILDGPRGRRETSK